MADRRPPEWASPALWWASGVFATGVATTLFPRGGLWVWGGWAAVLVSLGLAAWAVALHRRNDAVTAAKARADELKEFNPVLTPLRRKTPLNVLEHIEGGVPQERVREMLGTPSYASSDRRCYRIDVT